MGRMGKITVAGLLWVGALAMGSLEIYSDGVKYRYVPVDDYVGFVRDASARCGDREISLQMRQKCPESKRLCKEKKNLETLQERLRSVADSLLMLDSWISSAKPGEVDAAKWIGAAEKLGKKKAEWVLYRERLKAELKGSREHFLGQVSSENPRFLSRLCKDELELTLPAGVIETRLINVATLEGEKISIVNYLSLRNRSGVDITSKDARIYARKFRRILRPVHFLPWVLKPISKAPYTDKKRKTDTEQKISRQASNETAVSPSLSSPIRIGFRDYAVGRIELPSTGEEVRIRIDDYQVEKRCEEISYPWRDTTVYVACRFKPKRAVESDRWILKKDRRIISENAYGEYDGGKYLLFVDQDDEMTIRRLPILETERGSGIFGGKVRRKDGYRLLLDNKSERQKTVKIIERVPRSQSDKITVKLLKIEGAIQESLDEDGRLVMQTVLAPREHKEITVWFELIYDKGLQVLY